MSLFSLLEVYMRMCWAMPLALAGLGSVRNGRQTDEEGQQYLAYCAPCATCSGAG